MSSLHPDRLPSEGAASDQGASATLASAPGKTSRRATGTATVKTSSSTTRPGQRRGTLSTGSTPEPTSGRARTARTVTATVARTATATAARTASATAKAAATGARAAAAKAAATRATAAARRAASAEPAVAPKRRAAKATTAKTTTAKTTTAKTATAKTATAKAARTSAAKAPVTKAPATEAAAARATAPSTVVSGTPASAVSTAPSAAGISADRRPTPFPRTSPEVTAPSVTGPAVEDVVLPGAAAAPPGVLSRLLGHRPPSVRRRPSLYLAAALATVIGVSGGLSSAGPEARAGTETAAAPISVAEQLGITADAAAPVVDAETTDRLGELVASRAARDAEQTQAARVQAKADRAAAEAERRAAAAAAEAARPKASLPVRGARLTSGFGARWGTLHAGIDLAAPMRTPEYAVLDGIVLEAGPASGFGLAVYIQHENGDVTVYGHMDEILVSAGQVVKAGDTIALLGNRGQSTGPHLHFEVHQGGLGGTKIDPLPWLRAHGLEI